MSGESQGKCELNNKRLEESKQNTQRIPEFTNLGIVERTCEEFNHIFSPKTGECFKPVGNSCKNLLEKYRALTSGAYNLSVINSAKRYPVYCHMTDIPGCGGGGWTLVMKLNGEKSTFNYNSSYWTNKTTYNVQDGLGGLTDKETKLESYWETPFAKICVGMKVDGVTKWIHLDNKARSLHSIIANGTFLATTVGRKTWKSLITRSSLQEHCNREGFNQIHYHGSVMRLGIRLGIAANEQNDCDSCDSWLGFGAVFIKRFGSINEVSSISSGNVAMYTSNKTDIAAIGYVLVS